MTNFLFIKRKSKHFKHLGFFALMMVFSVGAYAQSTITGIVSDASGPIPGVNVSVKGTKTGITTDINGGYSIGKVPSNGVLVYSFIGYATKEVAVNGQTKINVTLIEETNTLKEVVVIGYGTQRKESVTGSVASITGEKLNEIPASNITQALQGRVAGIELLQTSSKPGASLQIRIRGTRSLTASNDPLIVLDGIPFAGTITDISTNDIKSIDILKDASATAIYGSRGANGVILVTSNKGRKGGIAKFSFDSYYGLKSVFAPYPMMDGPELAALRVASGKFPIAAYGADETVGTNTDWQSMFYSNAVVQNHSFNVSGGGEKNSYSFGLGYYTDEAVIPGQNFNRISLNGSIDQEIGDSFKIGFSTHSNFSTTNGGNLGVGTLLSNSPLANPYKADGTLKSVIVMPMDTQWVYTRESVNNLGDKWIDQNKAYGSYNNIYAEIKIPGVDGLKYRMNGGLNFRMSNSGNYTGVGVFSSTPTNPSNASVSNSLTTNWVLEHLLTYDKTFADKHKLNIVGLASAEQTSYNSSNVSAINIPSEAFQFYNLGQAAQTDVTVNPAYQGYYKKGLNSYMARAMYSYDDRYMISAAVRSDGSSVLAQGHKWHTYPALSAGWNVKNESFMENVKWLDQLKLRVGYGETSNQAINPYTTFGSLNTRPYNFGTAYATGTYVSTLPNPDLGWEYSKTLNYGIDFGVFNKRLTGTVEYYVTDTRDLLLNRSLPPTSGVGSYTGNIGTSQNKGFEVSLNGIIIDNPNGVTWEAGVNFYANENKITSLASGQLQDVGNWWFVGQPINVIYDYNKIGLWQTGDANLTKFEPGGNVGMIKVEYKGTFNADGTPTRAIGADDRKVIKVDPNFQGGFNTRVAYKDFDLSVVGAFQSGGTLISTLYSASGYLNLMSGRRGNVKVDYYTPTNTDAKYPAPGGISSGDNPKYGNTLGYFDASYVKIRTISLGYNFQEKFNKALGIDKFRLYCTVQNPFIIYSPYYKESGMDPETNSYGDQNQAVTNTFQKRLLTIGANTPSTRNVLVGFNLTF